MHCTDSPGTAPTCSAGRSSCCVLIFWGSAAKIQTYYFTASTDLPPTLPSIRFNAAGLTRNWISSICHFPNIRGRFILDFTRRILLDVKLGDGWSIRTAEIFNALQMPTPDYPKEPITATNIRITDAISNNILHAANCQAKFGRDLLDGIDLKNPQLYSDFNVTGFLDEMRLVKAFPPDFFDQPEYLFTPTQATSR